MDAVAATRNFIDAWNRRDRAAIVAALHEDVACVAIPLPPEQGRDAAMALFDPMLTAEEIDWQVITISAAGNVVLTERLDRMRFKGGEWKAIRAMGVFEFDGDMRMTAWRDYFDLAEMEAALGGMFAEHESAS